MLDEHYFPLSQDEINAIRFMQVHASGRSEAPGGRSPGRMGG